MKPKDFTLFIEAYAEREQDRLDMLRMHAYFCVAPHSGKRGISPQKFLKEMWPSAREAQDQDERIERLKKRHQQEFGKVKTNGEK